MRSPKLKLQSVIALAIAGVLAIPVASATTYVYRVSTLGLKAASGIINAPVAFSATSTGAHGTIQSWTVPTTGTYTAVLSGAAGGTATNYSFSPGLGAILTTKLSLVQGTVLRILVGQQGASAYYDAGGGGGTYVVTSDGTALAVAGGGGGAGVSGGDGYNASTSTMPTASRGSGGYWGGGGSGFSVQGYNDTIGSIISGGQSYSFLSGGTGGGTQPHYAGATHQAEGGFGGGGGGGTSGGGGGGGYNIGGQGGAGGNTYYTGTFVSSTASHGGAGSVTFTLN